MLWHLDHTVEPADVPSDHDFFDRAYVRGWAEDRSRKNPQRPNFFDAFADAIAELGRDVRVLDLGSGPGLLAEQILDRCNVSAYYLLDFSPEMHDLSRERLAQHAARTAFVEADFREPEWLELVPTPVDVAVSLQALHELRNTSRAPGFYRQLLSVLRPDALVLVCDHLRSDDDDRPLFMSIDEHVAALSAGGLKESQLVLDVHGMAMFRAANIPDER